VRNRGRGANSNTKQGSAERLKEFEAQRAKNGNRTKGEKVREFERSVREGTSGRRAS